MLRCISWQFYLIGMACVLISLVGCRTDVETADPLDHASVPAEREAPRYQWAEYLDGVSVAALAPEGDGMWVGLRWARDEDEQPSERLVRMDVATGERVGYSPPDGLVCVLDIAIDAEGTKWLLTYPGEVVRFDGQEWESYFEDDGQSDDYYSGGYDVHAVAVDSTGQVWRADGYNNGCRSGYGAMVFNGREWSRLTGPSIERWGTQFLKQMWVEQIIPDAEGGVWLLQAGWDGGMLLHCSGEGQWRTYTQFHDDVYPRPDAAAIDKEGRLWFGTSEGVVAFDGKNWQSFGPEQGVHGPVDAIATDGEGRIWATTEDAVICFEEGRWRECAPLFELQDSERERCYWISDVAIDSKGRLWVATTEGLKVLEKVEEG